MKQRRKNKDGTPYINHPLEVANLISEVGKVNDVIPLTAAVLHDTVEDTNTTYSELVETFNKEIADVVMETTDDKSLPKIERKKLQVEHAKHISDYAKLVKIADKISNLKDTVLDPPDWDKDVKVGYAIWSKAVVDNMRGVNKELEQRFDYWYNELLTRNGYNMAEIDCNKILEEYYNSMK